MFVGMFACSYAVTVLRGYDKVVAAIKGFATIKGVAAIKGVGVAAIKEGDAAAGAAGEVVAAGGGGRQNSTL